MLNLRRDTMTTSWAALGGTASRPIADLPRRGMLRCMTWSDLPKGAKAFRIAHVIWSVVSLASLGYVWTSALTRRRDPFLWTSVAFLALEGGALVVGRGDCPFGPLQARLGDPMPLFELVLPPRAAKAAVPALFGVSVTGLAALVVRRPGGAVSRSARAEDCPGAAGSGPGRAFRHGARQALGSPR